MKFPAKASADFEPVPAGNHVAICTGVIDFGLQPPSPNSRFPEPKPQVYLRFELPMKKIKYVKDGVETEGPMSIGRAFTASMSQKANLRKFIESWFGKKFPSDEKAADFDCGKLLGFKCLLNVTHSKDGKYANIENATPIPEGMPTDFHQANPSLFYSLESPDAGDFDSLPEWMRKKIEGRIKDAPASQPSNGVAADSSIPF